MSLNVCIDCHLEKKKCECEISSAKVKISWWRKIIYFLIG
jgi:hypothetical protein